MQIARSKSVEEKRKRWERWKNNKTQQSADSKTLTIPSLPPTLSSELGACWKYSSWSPSWELVDRCISARPSDRRTTGQCPFCPCPFGGFLPVSRTEQGIRNLV